MATHEDHQPFFKGAMTPISPAPFSPGIKKDSRAYDIGDAAVSQSIVNAAKKAESPTLRQWSRNAT